MTSAYADSGPASLVCTVSTVKDTPDNLDRFVSRNLGAGVDHMFLFVDDADPGTVAAMSGREHVTVVATGDGYWQGERPEGLNVRQQANANLVNAALSAVPSAAWLFHVDGDEQLHVDRERLLGLPDDVTVLRLSTLEAVSRYHQDEPVTTFKRQLVGEELALLKALGVIPRPAMAAYFRGHLRKPGVRPNLGRRLHIHYVEDNAKTELEAFAADWLQVLHFESHSGEEFVRKWTAHLGTRAHFRPSRDLFRNAVAAVVDNTVITEDQRAELLETLYHRYIEDDVELLDRLGYLVRPDVPADSVPTPFDADDAEVLGRCLEFLTTVDKRHFTRGGARRPAMAVRALRKELGLRDRRLKGRLDAALAAEQRSGEPAA